MVDMVNDMVVNMVDTVDDMVYMVDDMVDKKVDDMVFFSPNLVVGKQKHFPRHDLRLSAKTEMILNQKDGQVVELVKTSNSFGTIFVFRQATLL